MSPALRLLTPLLLIALGGCASSLTAIFERSVSTENFDEREPITRVLTLTGERRTVLAMPRDSRLYVCAEALPDVARSAAARSVLELQQGGTAGRSLSLDDQVATALLATFARTETADVVRQVGWQLCQAHANRAITPRDYAARLDELVKEAFLTLRTRPAAAAPLKENKAEAKTQPPRTRQQQGRSGQSGMAPADPPPATRPGTGDTTRKPGG